MLIRGLRNALTSRQVLAGRRTTPRPVVVEVAPPSPVPAVAQREAPPTIQVPASAMRITPAFLTDLVRTADGSTEMRRHRTESLHVSSLVGGDAVCPRARALAVLHNLNVPNPVGGPERVMWALGRAAEHHVRTSIIAQVNRENVIGHWACRCETHYHCGYFPQGVRCERCDSALDTYTEVTLTDLEANITGNMDFGIDTSEGILAVECKSKAIRLFEALTQPEANHVLQAMSYRRMLINEGADWDVADRVPGRAVAPCVALIYVAKDFNPRISTYKEFHVYSSPQWEQALDQMWENARLIGRALEGDGLPARLSACSAPTDVMPRNCYACASCFSTNLPTIV